MITLQDFNVIDLFCGVGGLTHGFVKTGFNVVAGYDIDASCKYAFETNNGGAQYITKDIKEVTKQELESLFAEKRKILVGCAPCQPFSVYTNKKKASKLKYENDPQ
jgi:DNA (cytosine-5)-methyltransferase 1